MIQRKKPLMAMLGNTQIPDSQGQGSGGHGLKELMADIKEANNRPSTQQYNSVAPAAFDPNSFYTHGAETVGGSRSGEKSSKPFLNRLLGGF